MRNGIMSLTLDVCYEFLFSESDLPPTGAAPGVTEDSFFIRVEFFTLADSCDTQF
jgi:hypothetical protein